MKKFNILMFALIPLLFFNGCLGTILDNQCEKGNGKIIQQNRENKNFNKIVLLGQGNVFVTQGQSENVQIETDENILPLITTSVNGSTLYINSENRVCPTKLNIYLSMKNINGFKIEGAGDIQADSAIITDYIRFDISGAGDIRFNNLKTQDCKVNIEGSGDVIINGSSETCTLNIEGSGDMRMRNFQTNSLIASINGSGDIIISVIKSLKAEINGSGTIRYRGNPSEVLTSTNGSGSIIKEN